MVLNDIQTKEKNLNLAWNQLAIEMNVLSSSDEIETFKHSIDLLEMVTIIGKINTMTKNLNSDSKIDTGIYFKAIESVFNETPFDESNLFEYYKQQKAYYSLVDNTMGLIDLDMVQIPYEIEFVLLGKSMRDYLALNPKDKEALNESYGQIYVEMQIGRMEIKDFIAKAKKIVS